MTVPVLCNESRLEVHLERESVICDLWIGAEIFRGDVGVRSPLCSCQRIYIALHCICVLRLAEVTQKVGRLFPCLEIEYPG
jgi:hypothetical protein